MANKAISELPQAQNVNNQDLFVLEQSGIAKKLTAETFITEQGIIDALAEALDGHGGIQSVTLSSVSGRIRTYRITFSDGSATTFQVYDGTSIERISRTSSSGLDDVYTVFLSDGTTTFFTVHNGADGNVSEAMLNDALKNKAPAITETTESSAIANFTDGADDMPLHNILAEINPVQDLTYGDPYPAGGGKNLLPPGVNYSANGITATWNANGSVTFSGTATANVVMTIPFTLPANTTVTFSAHNTSAIGSGVRFMLIGGDEKQVYLSNANVAVTWTPTADVTSARFMVSSGYSASGTVWPQIELGSTATSYAPYSNICPITGHTEVNVTRTGKNLIDIADKTMASEGYLFNQSFDFPSGQYVLSYYSTTPNNRGAMVAIGKDDQPCTVSLTSSGSRIIATFNAPNGIKSMRVYNGAATYTNIQLELSSTATAFEPYITPSTVSLSWQTEAGTVYGGTIDVATGLLTVDKAMVDLGTLTWNKYETQFYAQLDGAKSPPFSELPNALCSLFKPVSNASVTYYDNAFAINASQSRVNIVASAYDTVANFKTAMSGQTLVYELATPQTYQLTPQQLMTLLGTNNVWADTGNVSVTYPADTKLYIEKLTMPTEDDLVANQAITSGKYFMIGNSLYLALANIASGAQITIGTNAQRVSLADALNTINS